MSSVVKPNKKVLLIGMADSVHVARWLKSSLAASEVEVLLLPTSPHRRVHPEISALVNATLPSGSLVRLHRFLRYVSIFVWILDRPFLLRGRLRALFIAWAIRSFQPDFVHIMETQNGGYPYLAYADADPNTEASRSYRLALTLFGSDLYWFSKFEEHKKLLLRLLPKIDVLAAECERDITLARGLGFKGKVAKLSPVSGGLDPLQIATPENADSFSARDTIAVKGYGGTWGLGHAAIEQLSRLPQLLYGKRIVVFSAERAARKAAKKYLQPLGISYTLYPKFGLSHKDMLDLYRRSIIYVGLSRSDGLPASMLEAMSQGAFPVQTNSACIEGWFQPGISGVEVDVNNVGTVGEKVAQLLSTPDLLREAQSENLATINSRYSRGIGSGELSYEQLLAL